MITKEIKYVVGGFLTLLLLFLLWPRGTDIYDGFDLPWPGNPNRPYYQQFRNTHRTDVNSSVAQAESGNVPIQLAGMSPRERQFEKDMTAAREGRQYNLEEWQKQATLQGLTLPVLPNATVQSNRTDDWQLVPCLNVATKKYEACKVFPGDVIEGYGIIKTDAVKDPRIPGWDKRLPIGPCGIPDINLNTKPFIPDLPRYALIGRTIAEDGQRSKPFTICDGYTIIEYGSLETMVNSDYRDRFGRTHGEWADMQNKGSFGLRIKRSTQGG